MELIKKRFFWVVMGVLAVAALIASWRVTGPVRRQNRDMFEKLDMRRAKLQKYAAKGDQIKNEKWIERERVHKKLVESEVKAIQAYFSSPRSDFTKLFRMDPNDPNSPEIRDEALWRDRYVKECENLLRRLSDAEVKLGKDPIQFRYKEWGARVPNRKEIQGAQKEFWIHKDLVDNILALRGKTKQEVLVDRLISISLPAGKTERKGTGMDEEAPSTQLETERPVIEETYRAIPVEMTLDIDSRYLLEFQRELLTSPWRYNIQAVKITRVPKETKKAAAREERAETRAMTPRDQMFANTAVRVTIFLEGLDFAPLMKAERSEGAASSEGA